MLYLPPPRLVRRFLTTILTTMGVLARRPAIESVRTARKLLHR